jgi:uncharacterized membrane protein
MRRPKSARGRTAMASIRAELPEIEAGIQPAADHCGPNVSIPERIACGAAGVGMIAAAGLFSMSRRLGPRDIVPRAFSRSGLQTPNRSPHVGLAAFGGAMLYRAVSGFCPLYHFLGFDRRKHSAIGVPAQGVKCVEAVEVDGPPSEVFAFWRQLSNLPMLFSHLESVVESGEKRSHWIAVGPFNRRIEWDAEIINERQNELIAWRSIPDSSLDTAGSVHFEPKEDGGTKVQLSLKYDPPGGKLGISVAELLGGGLGEQLAEGLHKLQWVLGARKPASKREESTATDSSSGVRSVD